MEILSFQQKPAKTAAKVLQKKCPSLSTQPVTKMDEKITSKEATKADKQTGEIRQEPYTLPQGLHWDTVNIDGIKLALHAFKWSLCWGWWFPFQVWLSFRIPQMGSATTRMAKWMAMWCSSHQEWEACGLDQCYTTIHENLSSQQENGVDKLSLCPREITLQTRGSSVDPRTTRRVNLAGIFQAVHIAGVELPKPVGSCRYWHRSLNPKKLIEVKFSHLSRNMTMQRTLKLHKLPDLQVSE